MTFTKQDFAKLLRFLAEHPEERRDLLHVLLPDLQQLPQALQRLTEAQEETQRALSELAQAHAETDRRLNALAEAQQRTEAQVNALAEAQRRTDAQLEKLAARIDALAEAQQRTEAQVNALVEAQRHTDAQLEKLTARVDALAEAQQRTEAQVNALAEAQQRTEAQLEKLTARVDALAEAQQRTEVRLTELAEQVAGLIRRIERLEEIMEGVLRSIDRLTGVVGDLKGQMLELMYRDKPWAYFGKILRRLRVVPPHTLEDELEAHLSRAEFEEVLLLDILVTGHPRRRPELPEVWLAVEVSSVVDLYDVERARRRAELLRRAGFRAIPAVAGEHITLGAEEEARDSGVVLIQDGRVSLWEEALESLQAE